MWKKVLLVLALGLFAVSSFAKNGRRVTNLQEGESIVQEKEVAGAVVAHASKKWRKGKQTVIQLKGQASEESASCRVFSVNLNEKLSFKIQCIGQVMDQSIDLTSGTNRTVTQHGGHITITKYNYLTKKPQVSRLKRSTLKVPYVEEIIHLKKGSAGELSFYYESFKEDEFGRIVQDGFIQAHSLAQKKMKISSNHQ